MCNYEHRRKHRACVEQRVLRKQVIGRNFYYNTEVYCTNHTISSNVHTYLMNKSSIEVITLLIQSL